MALISTFAELTGTTIPDDRIIDGKNIWSLMSGESGAKSQYKTICGVKSIDGISSIHYQNWKLVLAGKHWTGELKENYFFLSSDIGETSDVVDQHPELVKQLVKMANDAILYKTISH